MALETTALLTARGLTVGYRHHPVVSGVDIDLWPGRITALIGPNGAGKSTILKTLTLQLNPLDGSVMLLGRPLQAVSAKERAETIA